MEGVTIYVVMNINGLSYNSLESSTRGIRTIKTIFFANVRPVAFMKQKENNINDNYVTWLFCRFIPHPFWVIFTLVTSLSNCWNCFVWLRITDEGLVPEMRIWSMLLSESHLKYCIRLWRSVFSYFNYLASVTTCGPMSPWGHI